MIKTPESKKLNPKKFKKDKELYNFAVKLSKLIEMWRTEFMRTTNSKLHVAEHYLRFYKRKKSVREALFKQLKENGELEQVRKEIATSDWSKLLGIPRFFFPISQGSGYLKKEKEFLHKVLQLEPKERLGILSMYENYVRKFDAKLTAYRQYKRATKTRKENSTGYKAAQEYLKKIKGRETLTPAMNGTIKQRICNNKKILAG